MRSSTLLFLALASLLDIASAHGFVTGVRVNGVFFKGFDPKWGFTPVAADPVPVGWAAKNNDIGFVAPDAFQTPHINCHKNATAAQAYAHVNPGDTIEFVWNQWIESHKGPIINYIAPCDGEFSGALNVQTRKSACFGVD
jgi:lytic cellulose monooxygenase (C1-hydroxylating)